jgi:hypothetical protein
MTKDQAVAALGVVRTALDRLSAEFRRGAVGGLDVLPADAAQAAENVAEHAAAVAAVIAFLSPECAPAPAAPPVVDVAA